MAALGVFAIGLAIYEKRKGIKLRDDRGYEPQTEADRELERAVRDHFRGT